MFEDGNIIEHSYDRIMDGPLGGYGKSITLNAALGKSLSFRNDTLIDVRYIKLLNQETFSSSAVFPISIILATRLLFRRTVQDRIRSNTYSGMDFRVLRR